MERSTLAPIRTRWKPSGIVLCRLGCLRLVYGLDPVENLAKITLGDLHVMVALQIEPKLRRCAERLAKPQRSIGRNAGLLADDPFDPSPRQAADLGKSARRNLERNEEFLSQNLAGVHGLELPGHYMFLMVVHDFHLRRAFGRPTKHTRNWSLIPDRELSVSIPRQRLQAIAGR
jgi:hypothetical protein